MEGLFEDYHLLSIIQRYLDLNDIMNLTLVNKRLYSKEWRLKMQSTLCLYLRMKERWGIISLPEADLVEYLRIFKQRALAHVSSTTFFHCWVGKCRHVLPGMFYSGQSLANRKYFKHTTCRFCALEILTENVFQFKNRDNFDKELRALGLDPYSCSLPFQKARFQLKEYDNSNHAQDWYYDKKKLKELK